MDLCLILQLVKLSHHVDCVSLVQHFYELISANSESLLGKIWRLKTLRSQAGRHVKHTSTSTRTQARPGPARPGPWKAPCSVSQLATSPLFSFLSWLKEKVCPRQFPRFLLVSLQASRLTCRSWHNQEVHSNINQQSVQIAQFLRSAVHFGCFDVT